MQKKKKKPIHLKITIKHAYFQITLVQRRNQQEILGNEYIFVSKLWDAAKEKCIEDLAHRRKENRSK